jgi:hypothetical protein
MMLCGGGLRVVAIGAAGLCFIVMGAQAAPMRPTLKGAISGVDQITQRCRIQNGVRYCYRSRFRDHNGYRVRNIPEIYPTGSQYWWEEMDRQNRGGRGGRN